MPILQPPLTTGTLTASGQTVSANVIGYSAAQISIHGTYAGVNLTFEGSDDAGTTWYPIQAVRAADATLEATSGALTNTTRLWYVAAGALTTVRVRATAAVSGTATIGITPVHDVDSLLGAGTGGGGGGGGAATVADGADLAEGATTDAAVTTDAAGTLSAKLRGLVKWTAERMPAALGSATMAQSLPVTLASDGPAVTGIGAVADAAVTTNTTGSLSGKLRGLVAILADVWDSVNHRLKVDGSGVTQPVSGTFWPATQPVSGTVTANAGTGTLNTAPQAGELHLGQVGGHILTPAAPTMTRPSDTTAYASGDLVANSTTAGSVVALAFTAARVAAGSFLVRRARIKKSGTTVTNAQFRLHLYGTDPTLSTGITNGDNGAWLTKNASYLGALDVTVDKVFSDSSTGNGVPLTGSEVSVVLASGTTVYGLLEARAAYTPANAETFDVILEVLPN